MSVNVIFRQPDNRSFAISYNVCTKEELQDMWRRSFGKIGTIYKGIQYEIVEA
ncbi:MAG: hypothetical protein WCW68_14460 [Methanothrix sp.]